MPRRKVYKPPAHIPAIIDAVRDKPIPVKSSYDVVRLIRPEIIAAHDEHICSLGINCRGNVIFDQVQFKGGTDECYATPREVFRDLLHAGATSFILVHNHPSGSPKPSAQDRLLTLRLAEAGRLINLRMLDHVIVATDGWYSFRDEGVI